MQYMFLIYLDESKFAGMTKSQRHVFGNGMLDYDYTLRASGHYIMGEPLKTPSQAVTLRQWGRRPVHDGWPLHGGQGTSQRLYSGQGPRSERGNTVGGTDAVGYGRLYRGAPARCFGKGRGMKFLCKVLVDDALAAAMTPEGWARMGALSLAYVKALMARGVFLAAEALEGRATARTVRVRQGDAILSDGPFMESK